jgi:N-acetyl-anhydromuramoyl-L-alanine amidase
MPRRCAWHEGWWAGARACPSPNFGPRPAGCAVTLAVLHAVSLPPGVFQGDGVRRLFTNTLDWDADPYYEGIRGLQVSAHFFVRRSGRVMQFVSCDQRAWHAGTSSWRGRENCNDWSIGIELEGLDGGHYTRAQYLQTGRLLRVLSRRYPLAEAVGHEHVAPGRKADPGPGFDWAALRGALRQQRPRLAVLADHKR